MKIEIDAADVGKYLLAVCRWAALQLLPPAVLAIAVTTHYQGCGPGPQPVPPAPVPPAPVDPFVTTLKAAYAADPAPDKAQALARLAAVYRNAGATVNDPGVTTAGQLVDTLHAAAESFVGAGKLKGLREAVASELDSRLQTSRNTLLDAPLRARYAEQFARVAQALGRIE